MCVIIFVDQTMVDTVVRRRCDPQIVQQLWQAIAAIRHKQKQVPSQVNLTFQLKYNKTMYNLSTAVLFSVR